MSPSFMDRFPSWMGGRRRPGENLVLDNLETVLEGWQNVPAQEWQQGEGWFRPLLEWDVQFLENPLPLVENLDPSRSRSKEWKERDRERIQNTYGKLIKRFPTSLSEACGWGSREDHDIVLNDLLLVGDLQGKSVLDLGCGPGHLLSHAKGIGLTFGSYLGVDVNEEFLQQARSAFPNQEFLYGDCYDASAPWLSTIEGKSFDYVFLCGVFAARPKGWSIPEFNQILLQTVHRFASYAKEALAFNVIPEIDHVFIQDMNQMKYAKYHMVNRMKLVYSLSLLGHSVRTPSGNFYRLVTQTPIFLPRR